MSVSQESAATIVCKEIFDGSTHPSDEEVLEYARRLGIDPDTEPHLLNLAREGLMAALPEGWLPCFHETSGAWYYYQASTGTTTWQHPLDAIYKEMVDQARAGNARPGNTRQISVEDDSKTTAKDLESHEEATLPKETSASKEPTKQFSKTNPSPTRIPTKLAPLKKLDKVDGARKKDAASQERRQSKRDDSRMENPLANNRAARDYTNLKFQDPKFYECPRLLETNAMTSSTSAIAMSKQEIDLKEVLKRSESLSPRHEKDWEQLSSRFNSEENIIDIDKLGMSTLARSGKSDKFDKEKHPSQFGQQKELTLSGGGMMFLKSNRSRDTTPSHEVAKIEEFQTMLITDESNSVGGDKLKSILRERQSEDDVRPVDEERKSVRFDIEKEVDIKFTYSRSEDESESESEEQDAQMLAQVFPSRDPDWTPPLQKSNSQRSIDETKEDSESQLDGSMKRSSSVDKIDVSKRNGKLVGKRFVVRNVPENEHRKRFILQNVSEKEHRVQIARDSLSGESLSRESSLDYTYTNKFNKIKDIDLVLKSETNYSDSETRRRTKSKVDFSRNEQTDDDDISDFSKVNPETDLSRKERSEASSKEEQSKFLEETKTRLSEKYQRDVEALKKDYRDKLEQTKKKLEKNFVEQKEQLEKHLTDKLEYLRRKMTVKEEGEFQKLIAEMEEAKFEDLKKVKAELQVCYEKEKQEFLSNLKTEFDARKGKLLELRNQEMGKLEAEYERGLDEEKLAKLSEIKLTKQHAARIAAMKTELDKEFEEMRTQLCVQQKENITKITEEHKKRLTEILNDFKINEGRTLKMYKQRLMEIHADFSHDTEKETRKQSGRAIHQDSTEFEKMRCEKRLLQDKYVALKEKYMKLKEEFRSAIERRNRRKEGYTTASETERSKLTKTRTEKTESSEQNTPLRNTHSSSATTNTKAHETQTTTNEQSEELHDPNERNVQKTNSGFQKSAATSIAKNTRFHSDDTSVASETNANMTTAKPNPATGNNVNNNNNNLENPVENIRKQLEKLEDLSDQLPSNETAYTLRYPFHDKASSVLRARRMTSKRILLDFLAPANASSELEFFRHRIHVERDSVKRAREALRHQENVFQERQKAWKQRSVKATLEQLVQEERELSDMEVNLHRTKSLLGEKVIHLRHLEQSLERVVNAKTNEIDSTVTKTEELSLSEMSSMSSDMSSIGVRTDTFTVAIQRFRRFVSPAVSLRSKRSFSLISFHSRICFRSCRHDPSYSEKSDHCQESTQITASLENLNSEIREIWGVLNKRQDTNIPPPPTLMYSYLQWLRFHHLTAQSSSVQGTFGTPNIQSNILSQLTVTQPPIPTTQNIIAQYGPNSGFTTSVCTVEKHSSNLMERTWNLRDWLRQTCDESTDQSRSNDSIKSNPQSIEKFASKRHSLGDSSTRFVDVDSMYLHVFLNQFKKTCFR